MIEGGRAKQKTLKKTSPKMMAGVRLPFRRAVPTWGLYSFFFYVIDTRENGVKNY